MNKHDLLARLAACVTLLDRYDMRHGGTWAPTVETAPGVFNFPYSIASEGQNAFHRAAYHQGWVTGVDWATWAHSPVAQRLIEARCADATVEQLGLLVTAMCRQDRFVEGGLAGHMEEGLVEGVLLRMKELLTEIGTPQEVAEAMRIAHLTPAERQRGAWLGLAVADALGAPYEFLSAEQVAAKAPARLGMVASRLWEAGEWTDDTDLTLATSMAYQGDTFELNRAAAAMVEWLQRGPKDVGNLTRVALGALSCGAATPQNAGELALHANPKSAGNGSLMRASPTGLRRHPDDSRLRQESAVLSGLTHADPRCVHACVAYNFILAGLVEGRAPLSAVENAFVRTHEREVRAVLERCLKGEPVAYTNAHGIGFVLLALERALVALRDSPGYAHGIDAVIRAGGDTDTNAAIAGALLGARFGNGSIPADWRADLLNKPQLERALTRLLGPANPEECGKSTA